MAGRKGAPAGGSRNPITTDSNLKKLLAEAGNLETEEAFDGWKDTFLAAYEQYLDPAGVENANASNDRLVRSLEKLAATVVSVSDMVDEGKITAESQSVQGKRRLTNMTEQMAATEKEVARFMPTTGDEEEVVGYDKYELGAVLIDDGFQVYEILKTTKDIIENLQKVVLNEVLPKNKLSIIQFYLRQIQTFCDVMADLGLMGLMEEVMDIYKVKPRSKNKGQNMPDPEPQEEVEEDQEAEPKRVLDPNKKYKFRAKYTGGYIDPFTGTQPGNDEEPKKKPDDSDDAEDDDDNQYIIYFDIKTGTIGKIPRSNCVSQNFIVAKNDGGQEEMQGMVEDDEEKEELIWAMKKAMKGATRSQSRGRLAGASSKSPGGLSGAPTRSKSPGRLSGAPTRSKSDGRLSGVTKRSKSPGRLSGDATSSKSAGRLKSDKAKPRRSNSSSAVENIKDLRLRHGDSLEQESRTPQGRGSAIDEPNNAKPTVSKNPKQQQKPSKASISPSASSSAATKPSADGWAKPGSILSKRAESERRITNGVDIAKQDKSTMTKAASTSNVELDAVGVSKPRTPPSSSGRPSARPSAQGWAKPHTASTSTAKPSAQGWAKPNTASTSTAKPSAQGWAKPTSPQGQQKQKATRPSSSGWSKPTSRNSS